MLRKKLARELVRPLGYEIRRSVKVPAIPKGAELDILELCLERLLTFIPDPFLWQIGAHDGRTGDPIRGFITRHNPRGVLLEPQKAVFERLKQTYNGSRLHLENTAISRESGPRTLYRSDADPSGQGASFDENIALSHMRKYGGTEVTAETVQCVTLGQLAENYPLPDILIIDTEGFDFEIIKMYDFSRPPQLLLYEHHHLEDRMACARYVSERGYKLAVTGINTLGWLTL